MFFWFKLKHGQYAGIFITSRESVHGFMWFGMHLLHLLLVQWQMSRALRRRYLIKMKDLSYWTQAFDIYKTLLLNKSTKGDRWHLDRHWESRQETRKMETRLTGRGLLICLICSSRVTRITQYLIKVYLRLLEEITNYNHQLRIGEVHINYLASLSIKI